MVSFRRDELSIVDKSRGLYTGFEWQRRAERISTAKQRPYKKIVFRRFQCAH
jgi:hypothetical protein